MLVTGNNNINIRAVSIQRDLNGLSFFDTNGNVLAKSVGLSQKEEILACLKRQRKLSSKILVTVTTDNFVTLPSDLYLAEQDELYFSSKSLSYDPELLSYFRCRADKFVLVSAIEREIVELISERFSSITYVHSLLTAVEVAKSRRGASVAIYESCGRCSIALEKDGELCFAEQLVVNTPSDLIYYLKKLISDRVDNSINIFCLGAQKRTTFNLLLQKFPNVFIV